MSRIFSIFLFIFIFAHISSAQLSDSVKYSLQPVTITATRISEPWIEIPLAITPLTKREISQKKGYGLDEVLTMVPGVMAQSRYGNQDVRIAIRGFGARGAGERSNAGTSRGIRVLLDGFPETEPDGRTSFDLIDLASVGGIEVVRSNASTLWGNAAGGVLNISSNYSFDNPYSALQSSFGSFGYRKEDLNVGTYLGEGRFFLTLSNANFDGWREHSSSTRLFINSGIVAPIGERTQMGVFFTGSSNLFRVPGPLTQSQYDSDPKQAQDDTNKYYPTYLERDERRFNRLGRLGFRVSHGLDDQNEITFSLHASPKYLQRSERNTFRDFNRYHVGGSLSYQNRWQFNEETRNIFVLGTDEAYQDGAIMFYNLVNGSRGDTIRTDKREGANSFGIFAQNELLYGDISITLGARFDDISYYSEDYLRPKLNASRSFSRLTPKAGVTYRLSEIRSVYINVGGGVEIPAGNETDPPSTFGQDTLTSLNPLLEPIVSTTFEIGTKEAISLGDGTFESLIYDAALYYIDVKNDIVPYSGGKFYFTAGSSRRIGGELGFTLRLRTGIVLQSAFTITDNRYSHYLVDSAYYKNPGKYKDLSENKIAGIPEFMYKCLVRYCPTFFDKAYAEVNVQGLSEYFADDANSLIVPSYNLFNLTVGVNSLELVTDKLSVGGFIGLNNLFNVKYASSAFINPDLDRLKRSAIFLEPGLPRNYVGGIEARFNL